MEETFNVIGLMSGSSLDGLDIAVCQFNYKNNILDSWEMTHSKTVVIPEEIRIKFANVNQLNAKEYLFLERDFSFFIAKACSSIIEENELHIDLIGSHGHTIFHLPKEKITTQIGDGNIISSLTNCPVVFDFRKRDILSGGVGTPMAPLADRDLFPGYDLYVNLGGIANISFIIDSKWIAYDLCPFNQVLNHFAKKLGHEYDDKGAIAKTGNVDSEIVLFLKSHYYLNQKYPKSLDNSEVFEDWTIPLEKFNKPIEDVLRSFVAFTSELLSNEINSLNSNTKVLITGGGAYHSFFIDCLRDKCPTKHILIPEAKIVDNKEAILIAYAALCRLRNTPNFISSVTGASEDVCGGTLIIP